jgi:polysaccharide export outer membrane protein
MNKSLCIITLLAAALTIPHLSAAEEDEMYRIRPGDQLSVYVHDNADLTMIAPVLPDGTISYPLVGNLFVQGLTTAGLQNVLTEKLGQYLQSPVVVVSVSSQTSYRVYVMGQVNAPGPITWEADLRLTDYLTLAGGIGQYANLKKCFIFSKDSEEPQHMIDLREIIEEDNQELNMTLSPDDTVVLDKRSGFSITQWVEVAQIFSIFVASATVYLLLTRER